MPSRPTIDVRPSEITPESVYTDRRRLLAGAAGLIAASVLPSARAGEPTGTALQFSRNAQLSTTEAPNSWDDVTTYNNFYEFGTDKDSPARTSGTLRPRPWNVAVGGACEVKGTFGLDDLLKAHALEERVYRFRCVEAWSMVIPWVGFPLADFEKRFKPTANAKYVALRTLNDSKQMPGLRYPVLDWPYAEGLRIDEATHPLAFLAVGVYGRVLPNQNGAPLRLVVPWKYGFKSIKSIVSMDFVPRMPDTSWNRAAPQEYGFYANVNPAVDHPRWSQKRERRIGGGFFEARRETLPFNGYADQVAGLYRGMDLARWY